MEKSRLTPSARASVASSIASRRSISASCRPAPLRRPRPLRGAAESRREPAKRWPRSPPPRPLGATGQTCRRRRSCSPSCAAACAAGCSSPPLLTPTARETASPADGSLSLDTSAGASAPHTHTHFRSIEYVTLLYYTHTLEYCVRLAVFGPLRKRFASVASAWGGGAVDWYMRFFPLKITITLWSLNCRSSVDLFQSHTRKHQSILAPAEFLVQPPNTRSP